MDQPNQLNQIPHQTNWRFVLIALLIGSLIGLGVFAYQYWQIREELQSQTQQVENLLEQIAQLEEQIEDLEIAEPADETADWQTYQNEEYGFEMKYPKDVNIQQPQSEKVSWFYFTKTKDLNDGNFVITIRFNSFDEFWNSQQREGVHGDLTDKILVKIAGQDAFKWEKIITSSIKKIIILLEKNNNLFEFDYSIDTIEPLEKDIKEDIFNQILSTFKFIDSKPEFNKYDNLFFGILELEGYLEIKNVPCGFDTTGTCFNDWAYFAVTRTENQSFYQFLTDNKGNSFVGENSIVLGCYYEDASKIESVNDGDDGTVKNVISGTDLEKLKSSSISNKAILSLEKPKLSYGKGAPDCYSHFRNFRVQ